LERQRILFLYSRLNGFVLSTLRAIMQSGRCDGIDVVYWSRAEAIGNHFSPEEIEGVIFHRREALDLAALDLMIVQLRPTTIYLSGWMDKGYLAAIRRRRAAGQDFTTVAGLDDQWRGKWRQRLGALWFQVAYRPLLDVMWVAGPAQYHYARRFGYAHDRIVGNLLSADASRFREGDAGAHRFVFVGRFDPVKGLEALLAAHAGLPEQMQIDWPLVLIGDGPLRCELEVRCTKYVRILNYLQPDGVAQELQSGGVGLLVSTWEQWGVSLHEMAMAGLPLIASVQSGATSTFLVPGFNGHIVRGGDVESLASAMVAMAGVSDEERRAMGRGSRLLSLRVSPEIAAASFLSARPLTGG